MQVRVGDGKRRVLRVRLSALNGGVVTGSVPGPSPVPTKPETGRRHDFALKSLPSGSPVSGVPGVLGFDGERPRPSRRRGTDLSLQYGLDARNEAAPELEGLMPDYKRNHVIPRFQISYWISDPGPEHWANRLGVPPYKGVWAYDLRKKRASYAAPDFNFAISSDVYVPRIDDERATSVEQWLSDLEGELASLCAQVHEQKDALAVQSHRAAVKALMAMFSLECRSSHNVAAIAAAIEGDPSLVEVVGGDPSQSAKQIALQNLINSVTERATAYGRLRLRFWYAADGGVLLCDRPTFSGPGLPTFIVLTSRVIASVEEGDPQEAFGYQYHELGRDFLTSLNKMCALQARAWIVADTEAGLKQYVEVVESDDWRRSVAADRVRVEPVRFLRTGFRISTELPKKKHD